jgi:cellulose synthase/poly-beta-1,6-N-acetylglucosamine synthase-like glycosyltransferase
MVSVIADSVFVFWLVVNGLLFIHVVHEFILMVRALAVRKVPEVKALEHYPLVTVQLPLYNEKFVVERLLQAVVNLRYPADKLEIQILDDSTDETSDLIRIFLKKNSSTGIRIVHIQRTDRTGFKAGALAHGTTSCSGEFIAIFDADFVPDPEFLLKTIPHFQRPELALVQTRWLHINEEDSILTRAQAVMLNTHFTVEHMGRMKAKSFINFNGTAGVWRKLCIEEAGGWQADTLTEDLDLSFRVQALGWKFEYLFDVGSPAELPSTFAAFRTQQYRWSKGAAECLRKNIGLLWRSNVSATAKVVGSFHLLNSSVYLLVVLILLLGPAVFYFDRADLIAIPNHEYLTLTGASIMYLLLVIFFVGHIKASAKKLRAVLFFIPSLLFYFAMTTGISVYMVVGVIEGYRGKKSAFIRTPKFGSNLKNATGKNYSASQKNRLQTAEAIGLCYGLFWIGVNFFSFSTITLAYGLVIALGFSLSLFFRHSSVKFTRLRAGSPKAA